MKTKAMQQYLSDLFQKSPMKFEGLNSYDAAKYTAASQSERWGSVIQFMDNSYRTIVGDGIIILSQIRFDVQRDEKTDSFLVMSSDENYGIPIISRDIESSDIDIMKNHREYIAAYIIANVSYYNMPPAVKVANALFNISKIASETEIENILSNKSEKIANSIDIYAHRIHEMYDISRKIGDSINSTEENYRSKFVEFIESARSDVNRQADNARNILETAVDDAQKQIDKLRTAQEELITIRPAVELWKLKSRGHAVRASIAFTIFVVLIACSVGVVLEYGVHYVSISAAAAGDKSLLATALVVAPILGIAWILRIVSRFALQNLTGMDDANQRQAIAATYLSLLGDKTAAMTEAERGLALQALFRPTGAAPEAEASPPSFVDVLNIRKDS